MRYIERLSEPTILIQKKNEWTKKFMTSAKKRPDNSKYGHSSIRNTLLSMSHNKCYYCESALKGTVKEIDHLVEIDEDRNGAFEWSNLFLSCENCNNKLTNKSILVSEVLNPCMDTDDEIKKHISFESEHIAFLTDKGDRTIKKFRLSSERLDHLRLRELHVFTLKLMDIKNSMIEESRKAMSDTEKESLKRFAKADAGYSLMFDQVLKKHNIN